MERHRDQTTLSLDKFETNVGTCLRHVAINKVVFRILCYIPKACPYICHIICHIICPYICCNILSAIKKILLKYLQERLQKQKIMLKFMA